MSKTTDAPRLATLFDRQPTTADATKPRDLATYDVVETKKKRRVAKTTTRNEDKELNADQRQRIKNTNMDQARNFSLIRWAVNKVLDFNTSFSFQSVTGDTGLDTTLEAIIRDRSTARNFDVSERMNRDQFVRTLYGCQLADGDAFALKIAGGHLQGIEGDRIKTPWNGLPTNHDKADFSHGIKSDSRGRPSLYCVCKRDGESLVYERLVSAKNMLPLIEYVRFDQGRGVSPLTSAANLAQDLYEGMDAYAIKAKMVAWAGMIIKHEAGTPNPLMAQPSTTTDDDGNETDEYHIPMNGKPWVLDMDPGDSIDVVESGTPPAEHVAHVAMLTRFILLALDIPYTFYDQTKGSYTIQKDAWTQWEMSSRKRRDMVQNWLNRWAVWQFSLAIADGRLTLPRRSTLADITWEWQHTGRPWMDTKELQIDMDAVRMGLESAEDVIKRRGKDPQTIVAQNANHYKRMKDSGVPTVAWDTEKTNTSITISKDEIE